MSRTTPHPPTSEHQRPAPTTRHRRGPPDAHRYLPIKLAVFECHVNHWQGERSAGNMGGLHPTEDGKGRSVVNDDAKSATARGYDVLSSSYNQIVPLFTYFGERLVVAAGVGEGDRVLDVATARARV